MRRGRRPQPRHGAAVVRREGGRSASAGKYFAPCMLENGSIVFSGSSARKPVVGMVAARATNAAVDALTRGLAVELAPIRVNTVSPGIVDTGVYGAMGETRKAELFAARAATTPAGRVGSSEDIAEGVVFALRITFLTGSRSPWTEASPWSEARRFFFTGRHPLELVWRCGTRAVRTTVKQGLACHLGPTSRSARRAGGHATAAVTDGTRAKHEGISLGTGVARRTGRDRGTGTTRRIRHTRVPAPASPGCRSPSSAG